MRTINLIVIHCSATREDKDFTEYDLDVCHRRRGFNGAGYHFYIRKNGDIKSTRPIEKIGARTDFMRLAEISRNKAIELLNKFLKEEIIRKYGGGKTVVYLKE